MLYTRHDQNLGRPEDAYLMGSNETSAQKGGKRRTRKNKKAMRGGGYLEMTVDDALPVGPRGGIMSHTLHNNHNVTSSTNLGASVQHNYQVGGSNICHDIKKVHSFYQVQQFWQSICPGAVMIYQNHLQKKEMEEPKLVKKIVIEYTKAFCCEVSALKSNNTKKISELSKKLKERLNNVKSMLNKLDKTALGAHKMVHDRHLNNLKIHKERVINKQKRTLKMKKMRKSLKSKYNKMMKKTRKMMKSRKQKGGYNQFLANTPYSASYSAVAGPLNPSESALANPQYIQTNNVHGVDNYNHYTGKGSETGVFDKAPKA